MSTALRDRFDAKWCPEPNTGCWLWTAAMHEDGYGLFGMNGSSALAHRVSWELARGAIPDGLCVLHRCDTPACVNPAHLWLGTAADNVADMRAKGRERKAAGLANGQHTHPERRPRGERHGNARLTDAQVAALRADHAAAGGLIGTRARLAREYGVSAWYVGRLVAGRGRN